MSNITEYLIQYGAKALDVNATQITLLLALLHYREMNGYTNICNPTHERLMLATGLKKADNIRTNADVLVKAGVITKIIYTDAVTKKSRCQYTINDEHILTLCRKVESEWYEKFKQQDEATAEQAEIIAAPEGVFTEQEVEAAVAPVTVVPDNKQRNPITGRIVSKLEKVEYFRDTTTDWLSALKDTRKLEEQKRAASTSRYVASYSSDIEYDENGNESPF